MYIITLFGHKYKIAAHTLYLSNLFLALCISLLVLSIVLYVTRRKTKPVFANAPSVLEPAVSLIAANDISAIAGDDAIATQLDLARAYIEADKKILAKKMLSQILQEGTHSQQQQAARLFLLL